MTLALVFLIFAVLIPPGASVYVSPGTPSSSSVTSGSTITFSNVNLTIRAAERIPVDFLNFTIFSGSTEVAYVKFYIDGTEITDYPTNKFTVTNVTDTSNLPYNATVGSYGYDEITGDNMTYGYGYGYASGSVDLTILYTIVYTTHTTGSFTARLFVNCSNYTYISATTSFSVTSGGGGGGGGTPPPAEEEEEEEEETEGTESSEETQNEIEETYGVTLNETIYANDTDGDGVLDSFTDPNGVLTNVNYVNISGHASFLISTNGDNIPEFFWDTTADTITPVTYAPGTVTSADVEADTITISTTVNKSGWIYIDVTDAYPDLATLTVQTSDGRVIASDRVWRSGGKIYVIDDPDTEYQFIYNYTILPPTFEPATLATFNTSTPTITISYQEVVQITAATLDGNDILDQLTSTDNMVYSFTPSTALDNGIYTLEITAQDTAANELTSSATYTIDVEGAEEPAGEFPWVPVIIVIIVIIIILIIFYLFKAGYLYVETEEGKKK